MRMGTCPFNISLPVYVVLPPDSHAAMCILKTTGTDHRYTGKNSDLLGAGFVCISRQLITDKTKNMIWDPIIKIHKYPSREVQILHCKNQLYLQDKVCDSRFFFIPGTVGCIWDSHDGQWVALCPTCGQHNLFRVEKS